MNTRIFFILMFTIFTTLTFTMSGLDLELETDEFIHAASAKVEEARRCAIDFESPAYFPSEWDAIEEQYSAFGDMLESSQDEIQQNAAANKIIMDAYDELFRKTIPLYAQAREDEIIFARDKLISTGFPRVFPEYLQRADKTALSALDQYEAGDYYKARDTAAAALNEYETLLIGARALMTRDEVVDRGLDIYDTGNFDKAEETAKTAIYEYEAGNIEAAKAKAEEALFQYDNLLTVKMAQEVIETDDEGAASVEIVENTDDESAASVEVVETDDESAASVEIVETDDESVASVEIVETTDESAASVEVVETDDESAASVETVAIIESTGGSFLPSQYTVRSWAVSRDCLWNIAGYSWVYGNPERWIELFEANRYRMPDPNNPDLIEPDMVLDIPSIMGETRQGMWDPNNTYPKY